MCPYTQVSLTFPPGCIMKVSILRATTRARLRVCLVPATWGSESKAIASEGAWLVWGWGYHSFGSRCKESPFQWYPVMSGLSSIRTRSLPLSLPALSRYPPRAVEAPSPPCSPASGRSPWVSWKLQPPPAPPGKILPSGGPRVTGRKFVPGHRGLFWPVWLRSCH